MLCFPGVTITLTTSNHFFSSDEISKNDDLLKSRFKLSKTLPETQKFHFFIPFELYSVTARTFSSSTELKNCVIRRQELNSSFNEINFDELKVDATIACVYLGKWYIGQILSRDAELFEVDVQFFKPPGEEVTVKGFQISF